MIHLVPFILGAKLVTAVSKEISEHKRKEEEREFEKKLEEKRQDTINRIINKHDLAEASGLQSALLELDAIEASYLSVPLEVYFQIESKPSVRSASSQSMFLEFFVPPFTNGDQIEILISQLDHYLERAIKRVSQANGVLHTYIDERAVRVEVSTKEKFELQSLASYVTGIVDLAAAEFNSDFVKGCIEQNLKVHNEIGEIKSHIKAISFAQRGIELGGNPAAKSGSVQSQTPSGKDESHQGQTQNKNSVQGSVFYVVAFAFFVYLIVRFALRA